MAKVKSIYQCQECGVTSSQWAGQCPGCQAWNTLIDICPGARAIARKTSWICRFCSRTIQVISNQTGGAGATRLRVYRIRSCFGRRFRTGVGNLGWWRPRCWKVPYFCRLQTQLSSQKPCLYVTGEESLEQIAPGQNAWVWLQINPGVCLRHEWRQSPLWSIN